MIAPTARVRAAACLGPGWSPSPRFRVSLQAERAIEGAESYVTMAFRARFNLAEPRIPVIANIDAVRKEASPLRVADEPPHIVMAAEGRPVAAVPHGGASGGRITAESLGSSAFKQAYKLRYAYVAGGMYMGVASRELVASVARAGMLSFFGAGGLDPQRVEETVIHLKRELAGHTFGVNLLCNAAEEAIVDILLRHDVRHVEAAAFIKMTPALVKYRLRGLRQEGDGRVVSDHLVLAKLSRPEVATNFLSPPPEDILRQLLEKGEIAPEQAELASHLPMADHICAEADSAGHTDRETAYALLPTICRLRDRMIRQHGYRSPIAVGAAGGIGTPEAAAAAFVLGADFILTGSVNQCAVEAGTSEAVKEMLQQASVQDTDYAPAADMFELGAKVQVLRRGVFFPARANKLYSLYLHHESLEDIDSKTRAQIEQRYFKRSFDEVFEELKGVYPPEEISRAEASPKHKMALVFRAYCWSTSRYALQGDVGRKVDFQVHCGQAMGAFNEWVKDTELEPWRNRHAGDIGRRLMEGAAEVLDRRYRQLLAVQDAPHLSGAP